jgi:hypothetical protein
VELETYYLLLLIFRRLSFGRYYARWFWNRALCGIWTWTLHMSILDIFQTIKKWKLPD